MTNSLSQAILNKGNITSTQNGDGAFKSTLNKCLDFFSRSGALRNNQSELLDLFKKAFYESPDAAIVLAFYLRDIRGGNKERLSFQTILKWLYENEALYFNKIVSLVPEYGYWRDILGFVDSTVVVHTVSIQLAKDALSKNPSLLAKWMPSVNAGKASRKLALKWMKALQIDNEAEYRRGLSAIRSNIKPVESYMSAGKWGEIPYSNVPSVAMKKLAKAFGRHDFVRFDGFIKAAARGEVKINSTALLPHDLVAVYTKSLDWSDIGRGLYRGRIKSVEDGTVEAQWSQLEDYTNGENVLVMPDVSGSMQQHGFGKVSAFEVSIALAIYFAQKNKGAFRNQMVTFSKKPHFITLSGKGLFNAVSQVLAEVDMGNTDLMASIKAILDMARSNSVPQEDMPKKLVILSDMQFDSVNNATSFDAIKAEYRRYGYQMPEIVFWNLNSSVAKNSPVTKDARGVALVSGASPANLQYILGNPIVTPMDTMLLTLNSERYEIVRKALA